MAAAKLAFIGDVMLGRSLNDEYGKRSPDSFWGTTLKVLTEADAVLANLECAITLHKQQWQRTHKVFHFGADPIAVRVLKAGNIKYVSLANNHILDFEEEGLLDTLQYLDETGIAHAGAGINLRQAMQPALLTVRKDTPWELRIGVISLTDNEPPFGAAPDKPGTWFTKINTKAETLIPLKERIAYLKAQKAGLIVLSSHWGPNMVQEPSLQFQDFAEAVIDLGVDLFHGHSSHIFQGVEQRGSNLILYDTGDILDDYAVDPDLRNDWSFIFMVEADNAGLIKLEMIPVLLNFARVDLAGEEEFDAICACMQKLCAAMGTRVEKNEHGLAVKIRQG